MFIRTCFPIFPLFFCVHFGLIKYFRSLLWRYCHHLIKSVFKARSQTEGPLRLHYEFKPFNIADLSRAKTNSMFSNPNPSETSMSTLSSMNPHIISQLVSRLTLLLLLQHLDSGAEPQLKQGLVLSSTH